jgi:hypothetical protein
VENIPEEPIPHNHELAAPTQEGMKFTLCAVVYFPA